MSQFFPILLLCSAQPLLPQSIPPCCPCPWVIYTCSLPKPVPFFLPLSSSHLPSGPCHFVPCFHASSSIFPHLFLLFIRFLLQVRSYGILSFTAWLISLSIMLSGSIHAVTKGRSSFFLLPSIPLCKCTTVF